MSGPGSLSARTDGGPGQPLRAATGGDYGDRKATLDQQRAAPLAVADGATGGGAPAVSRGVSPVAQGPAGIFGPTTRPGEPLTAGIDWGVGPGSAPAPIMGDADEVDLIIRQAARLTGSPHLLRLLDRVVR